MYIPALGPYMMDHRLAKQKPCSSSSFFLLPFSFSLGDCFFLLLLRSSFIHWKSPRSFALSSRPLCWASMNWTRFLLVWIGHKDFVCCCGSYYFQSVCGFQVLTGSLCRCRAAELLTTTTTTTGAHSQLIIIIIIPPWCIHGIMVCRNPVLWALWWPFFTAHSFVGHLLSSYRPTFSFYLVKIKKSWGGGMK